MPPVAVLRIPAISCPNRPVPHSAEVLRNSRGAAGVGLRVTTPPTTAAGSTRPTSPATGHRPRRTWSRNAGFWWVGLSVVTVLAASSAPSPLYPVYAEQWGLAPAVVTLVFAVYAVALLASLLTIGALSDHVGRRPLLLGALALEAVSLVLFALAGDAGDLVLARILQGLATGAFTGVASATLVDLQPTSTGSDGPQLGALVNSAGATVGLAVGALGTGTLIQLAPAPTHLVYVVLALAMVLLAGATWRLPETSARRRGAWRSLWPRAAVPPAARRRFLVVLPILVATWSMGGLFLSLGPSIAGQLLGLDAPIQQGLVVAVFTGSGATASVLARRRPARAMMLAGAGLLAAGIALNVLAVHLGSALIFLPSEVVAGAGFGLGFLGAFQTLTALSEPARRAELLAAVFVVNYLAFSIPAVAAGLAVPSYGLRTVAEVYGTVVVVLALLLLAAETVAGRRRPTGSR